MSLTQTHLRPRFIGIGAQRAATTWVHDCLRAHPGLFLPEKKEVHYFDENYERGDDWYVSHFSNADSEQLIGEITPNYLDVPEACFRINKDLPEVKLFAILREPVSRAISSYQLLSHRFTDRSFEEACRPGEYLVELGLYAKHLKRFYDCFDRSQIQVWLLEDIRQDRVAFVRELLTHIGADVERAVIPNKSGTNSVVFPRAQALLKNIGLSSLTKIVKQTPVGNLLRGAAKNARQRETASYQLDPIREYFREDICELEKLIDRDLSGWLNPPDGDAT